MSKTGLAERKKNRNIEIVMHNALHYFEANGYDNTTIEQLCDAAMISQSTFFNYFGTKEKIVELVMKDGLKDCYEFRCVNDSGQEFLVYIDTATGMEDNILILLHADGGILTK